MLLWAQGWDCGPSAACSDPEWRAVSQRAWGQNLDSPRVLDPQFPGSGGPRQTMSSGPGAGQRAEGQDMQEMGCSGAAVRIVSFSQNAAKPPLRMVLPPAEPGPTMTPQSEDRFARCRVSARTV